MLCLPLCSCARLRSQAVPPDAARKGSRPLLGVQRWDMYSGKGYTYEQELGYLPGKTHAGPVPFAPLGAQFSSSLP